MLDLNDLHLFERVGTLGGFSAAARTLLMPKSTVSNAVQRLEGEVGTRLLQRNSRGVALTEAGRVLLARCVTIMGDVNEAKREVETLASVPTGRLVIGAGVAFGANVLGELLPAFLRRFPDVDLALVLASTPGELDSDRLDVAIRIGSLPPSSVIARRLGALGRHLCAAPTYLESRAAPRVPEDLRAHDLLELPGRGGRVRSWTLTRDAQTSTIEKRPRVEVNDVLTLHRLMLNGAGIGCLSGYLCGSDILAGRLVELLPGWTLAPLDVHVTFPSKRDLAPSVRAFVDFLVSESGPGRHWQDDPLL